MINQVVFDLFLDLLDLISLHVLDALYLHFGSNHFLEFLQVLLHLPQVVLLGVSSQVVAEVEKYLPVLSAELLTLDHLVEVADLRVGDSPVVFLVGEYFVCELEVDRVEVHGLLQFGLHDHLELLLILDEILLPQFILVLQFGILFLSLTSPSHKLSHSEYFKFVLDIGLFTEMDQSQVNQVIHLLLWDPTLSRYVEDYDKDLRYVQMFLLALVGPESVGIFLNYLNVFLELFGLSISHFD